MKEELRPNIEHGLTNHGEIVYQSFTYKMLGHLGEKGEFHIENMERELKRNLKYGEIG